MCMKPGTVLKYIHRDSDHPPSIIRAISKGVNNRLSRLSSSEAIFNTAAPPYQEADLKFVATVGTGGRVKFLSVV